MKTNEKIIEEVRKLKSIQPMEFSYEEIEKALILKENEIDNNLIKKKKVFDLMQQARADTRIEVRTEEIAKNKEKLEHLILALRKRVHNGNDLNIEDAEFEIDKILKEIRK